LNPPEQDQAGSVLKTRLPPSSDLLHLGSQTPLLELFPMAAYAVRAPDGVIAWYNSRAVELWGRVPAIGDTDERFCGAYRLYHGDGTHMAHCDTPVALALETGASVHEQEVIIEKPDGSRVTVSVYIDPIRDRDGAIIGVVNFFHDIHERKQAEKALRESELASRLLRLQDEERRRIGRELHDGVGQLLAAMSMNASSLERESSNLSPEAGRCLEENRNLLEQASSDIRTMSYLFHPPLLDELGLQSALKWYVEGFAERSKIAASLELPVDLGRLPKDHEMCLFRLVQESLTNIHRHSESSTALVMLWRTPGEVRMEVSDEGRGIHQEIQSKIASGENAGVGLRGMQERVKQIGGTLEIHSNGKGTSVLVTLPLTEDAAVLDDHKAARPQNQYERSRQNTKPPIERSQAV
jgi:signal transduction histidine kinase